VYAIPIPSEEDNAMQILFVVVFLQIIGIVTSSSTLIGKLTRIETVFIYNSTVCNVNYNIIHSPSEENVEIQDLRKMFPVIFKALARHY